MSSNGSGLKRKIKMKIQIITAVIAIMNLSCGNQNSRITGSIEGYNLNIPDAIFTLPKILHEISGQTTIDSSSVACIQDQNGIIFIYDALNNRILQQFSFGDDGDYEDIAKVDSSIYVLRSDGKLIEMSGLGSKNFVITSYKTGIPCKESEGLCFDNFDNRLLISCKGETEKKDLKGKIAVYSFDPGTKKLSPEPFLIFDLKKVRKLVSENESRLSVKNKKSAGQRITFKISAISMHPKTGELYLLSSIDAMLFIAEKKGAIRKAVSLDRKLFNQPEGLSFFANGDMLISNEGGDGKPTLLRFNYR
jgi:hypothetical protein